MSSGGQQSYMSEHSMEMDDLLTRLQVAVCPSNEHYSKNLIVLLGMFTTDELANEIKRRYDEEQAKKAAALEARKVKVVCPDCEGDTVNERGSRCGLCDGKGELVCLKVE